MLSPWVASFHSSVVSIINWLELKWIPMLGSANVQASSWQVAYVGVLNPFVWTTVERCYLAPLSQGFMLGLVKSFLSNFLGFVVIAAGIEGIACCDHCPFDSDHVLMERVQDSSSYSVIDWSLTFNYQSSDESHCQSMLRICLIQDEWLHQLSPLDHSCHHLSSSLGYFLLNYSFDSSLKTSELYLSYMYCRKTFNLMMSN